MHTLSYCPFRNEIMNFRDHHSSKRSINLIDPIYIYIYIYIFSFFLLSMPGQVRMKKKKKLKDSFKGRDRSENQVAHFSFLFRKKLGYSKLFYHHEQIRLSQSIIVLFLFHLSTIQV